MRTQLRQALKDDGLEAEIDDILEKFSSLRMSEAVVLDFARGHTSAKDLGEVLETKFDIVDGVTASRVAAALVKLVAPPAASKDPKWRGPLSLEKFMQEHESWLRKGPRPKEDRLPTTAPLPRQGRQKQLHELWQKIHTSFT